MGKPLVPVAILPWLQLRDEVTVGRTVFWPYKALQDKFIVDVNLRDNVRKYVAVFRDGKGEVPDVTCASYPADMSVQLTRRQSIEIMFSRNALFAAAHIGGICQPHKDSQSHYCPSADHFALHPLPINKAMEEGRWAVFYPRLGTYGSVERLSVVKPQHLHECSHYMFEPLLRALSRTVSKPCTDCSTYNHNAYIWRSLEWLFHSQNTNEQFSEEIRLVMQQMAIEAAMGEVKNRVDFVKRLGDIGRALAFPRRYKVWVEKKKVSGCMLEKWASEFYELRNTLVHSKVKERNSLIWNGMKYPVRHEFIASYVWFECMWAYLQKHSVIPLEPAYDENNPHTYWQWANQWRYPVEHFREDWKAFLTGKTDHYAEC